MKFRFNDVSKSAVSALIFSMGMAVSASVLAEPQAMPGAQQSPSQLTPEQQAALPELKRLQQTLQTTQGTLQGLQQKAFEKNPSLVKLREKLQTTVFKKMSTKDYNAETEVLELQSIASKYQDGKIRPTETEVLRFRQRDQVFQQRKQEAFQDPVVQKMSMSLKNDVEKAMVAIDPKTKKIMAKMESAMKRFMELRQKVANQ